jgi:ABC-type transporter Mla MlaB component
MGRAYEFETTGGDAVPQGKVIFHTNPTPEGWGQLEHDLDQLLSRGILRWKFDLQNVRFCDSHGLGMWLRINTRVREAQGEASYLIREPSRVLDLFRLTKLDQVLNLRTLKAGNESGSFR